MPRTSIQKELEELKSTGHAKKLSSLLKDATGISTPEAEDKAIKLQHERTRVFNNFRKDSDETVRKYREARKRSKELPIEVEEESSKKLFKKLTAAALPSIAQNEDRINDDDGEKKPTQKKHNDYSDNDSDSSNSTSDSSSDSSPDSNSDSSSDSSSDPSSNSSSNPNSDAQNWSICQTRVGTRLSTVHYKRRQSGYNIDNGKRQEDDYSSKENVSIDDDYDNKQNTTDGNHEKEDSVNNEHASDNDDFDEEHNATEYKLEKNDDISKEGLLIDDNVNDKDDNTDEKSENYDDHGKEHVLLHNNDVDDKHNITDGKREEADASSNENLLNDDDHVELYYIKESSPDISTIPDDNPPAFDKNDRTISLSFPSVSLFRKTDVAARFTDANKDTPSLVSDVNIQQENLDDFIFELDSRVRPVDPDDDNLFEYTFLPVSSRDLANAVINMHGSKQSVQILQEALQFVLATVGGSNSVNEDHLTVGGIPATTISTRSTNISSGSRGNKNVEKAKEDNDITTQEMLLGDPLLLKPIKTSIQSPPLGKFYFQLYENGVMATNIKDPTVKIIILDERTTTTAVAVSHVILFPEPDDFKAIIANHQIDKNDRVTKNTTKNKKRGGSLVLLRFSSELTIPKQKFPTRQLCFTLPSDKNFRRPLKPFPAAMSNKATTSKITCDNDISNGNKTNSSITHDDDDPAKYWVRRLRQALEGKSSTDGKKEDKLVMNITRSRESSIPSNIEQQIQQEENHQKRINTSTAKALQERKITYNNESLRIERKKLFEEQLQKLQAQEQIHRQRLKILQEKQRQRKLRENKKLYMMYNKTSIRV